MGSVLADITARNGKVMHMEPLKNYQIITAEVP
ncbi:hypothetical protein CH330_03720, partial [candidate division WOR-3 bacterium JGI_Cruoil_03_51_56]